MKSGETSVAALLTLIGYSVTDKVVVYDRIRENLAKHRTMPLRQLIDLSINQTLGRTVAISLTVLLSALPLAVIVRRGAARLGTRDHLRDLSRHVLVDLHRLADSIISRREATAPRASPRATRPLDGGAIV